MSLRFRKVIVEEKLPAHFFNPVLATEENKAWEKDFGISDIDIIYEIDCVKWEAHGTGPGALALVDAEAWKAHLENLVSIVRSRLEGISG